MIALLAILHGNPVLGAAQRAAAFTGVTAAVIRAVVEVESGGRRDAVSSAGCVGAMQVAPATAEEVAKRIGLRSYRLDRIYDNVLIGSSYLAWLLARYGNLGAGLTAYNVGMGTFEKSRRTNAYARRVIAIATQNLRKSI